MKKQILVFPGQGSQVVGMGKDFFDNFKESRHVFEEASDTIKVNLKKLCFDGPLDELTLTENLQPALYTTEVAILEALKTHTDLNVAAVAGHSLGEYSALTACSSMKITDGVRLTRLRGGAMQRAVPKGEGSMAAIMGLSAETVEVVCALAVRETDKACEPANFNSNGQVVISGSIDGVNKACEIIKTNPDFKGGKCIPLQVSAPFHCTLMRPAQDEMQKQLEGIVLSKPVFGSKPCFHIPNVTAVPTDDESQFGKFLVDQIVKSVRWEQSMSVLPSLEIEELIEVGPGKVLCGLMKRINREIPTHNIDTVENLKKFKV